MFANHVLTARGWYLLSMRNSIVRCFRPSIKVVRLIVKSHCCLSGPLNFIFLEINTLGLKRNGAVMTVFKTCGGKIDPEKMVPIKWRLFSAMTTVHGNHFNDIMS